MLVPYSSPPWTIALPDEWYRQGHRLQRPDRSKILPSAMLRGCDSSQSYLPLRELECTKILKQCQSRQSSVETKPSPRKILKQSMATGNSEVLDSITRSRLRPDHTLKTTDWGGGGGDEGTPTQTQTYAKRRVYILGLTKHRS